MGDVFRVQLKPAALGDPTASSGGPVAIWAHGSEMEVPEKLCQVLSDTLLGPLLEEVNAGHRRPRYRSVSRHDLICPEDDLQKEGELQAKWGKRLANALGGRVAPDPAALAGKLTLSPRCHAFHFHYPASGSPRVWGRLLDAFADFWADPAWAMPSECRFVVFLALTYPGAKERRAQAGRMERAAARARRLYPDGRFLLLDPVRSVSLTDALQWAHDPLVSAAAGAVPGWSPARVERAIRATYGKRTHLPMLTLLAELPALLHPVPNH